MIDFRHEGPSLWRIKLAVALWVGGFFLPLAIPLVIGLPLPLATKTAVSGLLVFGLPQLLTVIAIVLIGKPGFHYFRAKLFSAAIYYVWRQRDSVSRAGHSRFGRVMPLLDCSAVRERVAVSAFGDRRR